MMKMIIALAGALLLSAATITAHADNFSGQKTLGLTTGYSSYNKSAVAGVEFTYRFCRNFRLAPSVDYVFRRHGVDALQLNIDCQMPVPVARGVAVFPYAGLNYSSYNRHLNDWAETDDSSQRVSRFGLNLGAGLDLDLTRSLRLGVSAGYTFIKKFHGTTILAKIAYRF